jgi:hypothetical protein
MAIRMSRQTPGLTGSPDRSRRTAGSAQAWARADRRSRCRRIRSTTRSRSARSTATGRHSARVHLGRTLHHLRPGGRRPPCDAWRQHAVVHAPRLLRGPRSQHAGRSHRTRCDTDHASPEDALLANCRRPCAGHRPQRDPALDRRRSAARTTLLANVMTAFTIDERLLGRVTGANIESRTVTATMLTAWVPFGTRRNATCATLVTQRSTSGRAICATSAGTG